MAPRTVVRAIAALTLALALAGCDGAEPAPLAPSLELTVQQAPSIFTINSTGDEPDPNLGQAADDRLCDVDLGQAGEQCTLRAAIENAIETTRDAEYHFDLGAGVHTIQVGSSGEGPLPSLLGRAVIDGSTGGSTLVELDGSQAGVGRRRPPAPGRRQHRAQAGDQPILVTRHPRRGHAAPRRRRPRHRGQPHRHQQRRQQRHGERRARRVHRGHTRQHRAAQRDLREHGRRGPRAGTRPRHDGRLDQRRARPGDPR